MKRKSIFSAVVAVALAAVTAFGGFGPAVVQAATTDSTNDKITYVALGDSMTNGYGLEGYEPQYNNEYINVNGYMREVEGSYPVNFATDLATLTGKEVDLIQLATSATRADDTLYLLKYGTEDELAPDDYTVGNVPGRMSAYYEYELNMTNPDEVLEHLADTYQESIEKADVISVGVGSNNFSTFLTRRIGYYVGAMAPSFGSMFGSMYDITDLPGLLEDIDPEVAEVAVDVQKEVANALTKELAVYGMDMSYVLGTHPDSSPLAGQPLTVGDFIGGMAETTAYTTASYMVSYKGIIDHILEVNPDADIIIVGLSNWLNGMNIELADGVTIPVGTILDYAYEAVNVYMAALPAVYDGIATANEQEFANIYYAEVGDVQLLSEQMAADKEIPTEMTRRRMVRDVVGNILSMMGNALGAYPAEIDVEDVEYYESVLSGEKAFGDLNGYLINKYNIPLNENTENVIKSYYISCVGYLGIEKAFMNTVDLQTFPMGTFITLATEGEGGLQDTVMDAMASIDMSAGVTPDHIYDALVSTPSLQGLCNIFAIYVAGDGVLCHPSKAGHKQVSDAMINAYENEITATEVTIENAMAALEVASELVAEYYDEAYAYAYDYAKEEGYITAAVNELTGIQKELASMDINDLKASDEFKTELTEAVADAIATIEELKTLLTTANELDDATYQQALVLLGALEENLTDVTELLTIAGYDLADAAWDKYVELKPIIEEKIKEAVAVGTEKLLELMDEAYDAMVEALTELAKEYGPEVAEYIYDWFYNNPDKVIAFFEEYGDEMLGFIEEYYEEIFMILGFLITEFGDDVADYVMENPEEVWEALVYFYEVHGEDAWNLILVYAEELGIIDALEKLCDDVVEKATEIQDLVLAELAKIEAQIKAEIAKLEKELETALETLKPEIEKQIAELEATLVQLEALAKQMEQDINDLIDGAYEKATTGEYNVDADSHYVAIGDSVAASKNTYAGKLADTLAAEYGVEEFTDLSMAGFRTEDIRYILDETYELDAYGMDNTKDVADEIRADYIAAIKDADFITVSLGNDNFTSFVAAQIAGANYEMDWARYVTEDGVPYVEKALAAIADELMNSGLDAETAQTLSAAVAYYAYGFAGFAANYAFVLNEIHEINPDAEVVVVGMFNPIDALTMELDGSAVAFGEYVDYFIEVSNQMFMGYAALTDNTTFVAVPETEAVMDSNNATSYQYLMALITASKNLLPSNDGHEYIKDEILGAITITPNYLKGDVNMDGIVDDADVNLLYRGVNKYVELTELQKAIGNVNEDTVTDDADVNLLYRYVNHYVSAM